MLSSGPLLRPPGHRSHPPSRAPSSPAMPPAPAPPASSRPQVYYPSTLAMWWGSRWLRAGPVRSLPRNRSGNRRRPREVGASERVVSPVVEVAEEGYSNRGERSSRLYRGGGCESRELDRQLVHDPDRLLFQGFRFPVRAPVRRDEAVFSIPRVSSPSLSLSVSLFFLFSVTSSSPFPFSPVFPFANRQLSQSSASCHVRPNFAALQPVRPAFTASSCSPSPIVGIRHYGLFVFVLNPVRGTMRGRIVHARGTSSPDESNYG